MDIEITDLILSELRDHAAALIEALPRLAAALLLIMVIWGVSKIARKVVHAATRRLGMREALVDLLAMLVPVAIWLGGLLIAAAIVFPSVTPGKLITALGLGSIAIGFAFKDVFENFLAGVLILVREPFRLHDHIACDDIEGAVERISIRDTHIRQTDGQRVVVPNAQLLQNPITVRTDTEFRRTSIICGVAYGEDADAARDVIEDAVRQVDSVRDDVRDVQVFAQNFGASSIDFEIAWWTGSRPVDIRASRDQVVSAVKRALDEAGIEIPFPYRTLTFKEPISLMKGAEATQQDQDE
ncbi:MAG: mechanosensitive ion channel family protein [Pseudomonadota bacterium]